MKYILASVLGAALSITAHAGYAAAAAAGKPTNLCASYLATDVRTELPLKLIQFVGEFQKPGRRLEVTRHEVQRFNRRIRAISNRAPEKRTFDNTIFAFDKALYDLNAYLNWIGTLNNTGVTLDEKETDKFDAITDKVIGDVFRNPKLFAAISQIKPSGAAQQKLFDIAMKIFKSSGMGEQKEASPEGKAIFAEIQQRSQQFSRALQASDSSHTFTPKELVGVPEGMLADWPRDQEGNVPVQLGDTRYRRAILSFASNEDTRRTAYQKSFGRVKPNVDTLGRIVELREKLAQIDQGKSFLESRIDEDTLPGNVQTVLDMVDKLTNSLQEPMRQRMAQMTALKKRVDPTAVLKPWDILYFEAQLADDQLAQEIAKYFPAELTVERILNEVGRLFGVEFREVKDAPRWHESVKLYEIWDTNGDTAPLTYAYLDLYSYPGKISGQSWVMTMAETFGEGDQRRAAMSMLLTDIGSWANLKKESIGPEKLVTMAHELGHLLHLTAMKSPYPSIGFGSFGMDMVEIPSNVFESLAKDPIFLRNISGVRGTGEQLPLSLVSNLSNSFQITDGAFFQPIFLLDRLMITKLDLALHDTSGQTPMEKYARVFEDFYGIAADPEDHFPGVFHHQMAGYGGIFYSYIWATIAASNIVPALQAEGGLSQPAVARKFRDEFLSRTHAIPARVIIEDFLGGPVQAEPMLRRMGVDP